MELLFTNPLCSLPNARVAPGLLCGELSRFLNPRVCLVPTVSPGPAGMRDTVPGPRSLVPPSSSRGQCGHAQTCLPWSLVLLRQPGGKLFCCRAKALPSQPPICFLRWECIHLLGLVLFLWKNCSGRELYSVSQQDGCPMPGAVTAAVGTGRAAQGHHSPRERLVAK